MVEENYRMVIQNIRSTVVTTYKPLARNASTYQSEAELEEAFIKQLEAQAYTRLNITSEPQLISHLRAELERLNNISFTDKEWERFFKMEIANQNDGIKEKTRTIQEDYIKTMTREDGTQTNIYLIDKESIHNNSLQVINQYVPEGGAHENRYDVTILVNGLPLVHVELKRRGVSIKEAFNQINRYSRDSFWAGSGLFQYVQLFVISNGTITKYYSNTTREAHIKEKSKQKKSKQNTSHSFEFTSYWADASNKIIPDLVDFTATFFSKHTLLNILTKYCILTSEDLLLVMRPYQIAATEAIIQRINTSSNRKVWGKTEAGGYIWHTTGSGKTLTSFKTARLASKMEGVDKVLFVVDRKDLDYQTMKEYDRFEKGAANSNRSTAVLTKQLENDNCKIIITTIQKLSSFIKANKEHSVFSKHVVMIFDECHRSQFGEMHTAITKKFKQYHIFGFTGTPIFAVNSGSGGNPNLKTTEQAFGEQLHIYTIVDAIQDGNVLPFRIDYISTMKNEKEIMDEQVKSIDRERALLAKQRVANNVTYIIEHFNQKTKRNGKAYVFNKTTNISKMASAKPSDNAEEIKQKVRLSGFNSIFAVASIDAAKAYYLEFERQMKDLAPEKQLKFATIFSYGANEEEDGGLPGDEDSESTDGLDASSRDFLAKAIEDYNGMFGTSYDTSADKFQNYYKDVSLRMKNREIDILIVVNMFLTGFDATTLNTLWVDKNLKQHGLLQAYSRTNRILNSIKSFGNIVCFRDLEAATNESISLFGDKEAGGIVIVRTFEDYYYGFTDDKGKAHPGYRDMLDKILEEYPIGERIVGEENEKKFIRLFGGILRMTNLLLTFDQFEDVDHMTERDYADYKSVYLDLYDKYRNQEEGDVVDVSDDIEFEIELVKSVEVNIDYILYLIQQLHDKHTADGEVRVTIQKAVDSSPSLRNKRELIERFINSINPQSDVEGEWQEYVKTQRKKQLDSIIAEEKLKEEETYNYIASCFKEGQIQESGTGITKILPPMPLFGKNNAREQKKATVIEKLKSFFDRFFDISNGKFEF